MPGRQVDEGEMGSYCMGDTFSFVGIVGEGQLEQDAAREDKVIFSAQESSQGKVD